MGRAAPATYTVLVAPLVDRTYRGREVQFRLDRDLVSSADLSLVSFHLDPGDGAGERPLSTGVPLRARYETTGEKLLRLRASSADGRVFHAAAWLTVEALDTPVPDDTLALGRARQVEKQGWPSKRKKKREG